MISAQYGTEFTHSHYEKLKKVYSIWICMNSPAIWRDTITAYRIAEENIQGSAGEKRENYDLIKMVMVCPGDASKPGTLLRMLRVLFSNKLLYDEKKEILDDEFDIELNEKDEEEVSQMCNISYGIAEESYEEGRSEGREEGREEGVFSNRVENLKNLMSNLNIDFDHAADILMIPDADREKIKKSI